MLKNFPYLNKEEIEFYFDQIYLDGIEKKTSKKTLEISFTGPKYSQTFEKDVKNLTTLKKLDLLIEALRASDEISNIRPISERDGNSSQFVYEKVLATKMYFPKSKFAEIHGLNHLVVWVANPEYSTLSKKEWTFSGTFLYLIESAYDTGSYRTTLSGCSALQALVNLVTVEQNLFEINIEEPLGRNNIQHPIDKLANIGAISLGEREIETIYRKRYFTDEQCFIYNDHEYRCNDLLGYPLFIDAQY